METIGNLNDAIGKEIEFKYFDSKDDIHPEQANHPFYRTTLKKVVDKTSIVVQRKGRMECIIPLQNLYIVKQVERGKHWWNSTTDIPIYANIDLHKLRAKQVAKLSLWGSVVGWAALPLVVIATILELIYLLSGLQSTLIANPSLFNAFVLMWSALGIMFLYFSIIWLVNVNPEAYSETYEADTLSIYQLLAKQDKIEIEAKED